MKVAIPIFFDIEQEAQTGMFDLVSWGMEIGQMSAQQSDSMPFEQFIQGINQVYATYHRGEGIGSVVCEVVDNGYVKITSSTPYPDDLEYGVFYGEAKALLAGKAHFSVEYDEDIVRRSHGGDYTVYKVNWG